MYAQSKADTVFNINSFENKSADTLHFLHGKFVCLTAQRPIPKRAWLVGGTSALLWTGSFIALNQAWYSDYDRASFHFFNDNIEWQQVDKIGHIWSTYHVSRVSAEAWRWTNMKDGKSILLGGVSSIAYQTIIEIQDGYSRDWGFSWGDMGANLAGAGLYVMQELKWKNQRLSIKFSYWPYNYDEDLMSRRNQLFGSSFMERILKDYNSQRYWLSGNIRDFFPGAHLPAWLNLSFGYQATGMLGGRKNAWMDNMGTRVERFDIARKRHYFISPDIDFTKIKTNRKGVRKLFFLLNAVKVPAPSVEVDSKGKLRVHALSF